VSTGGEAGDDAFTRAVPRVGRVSIEPRCERVRRAVLRDAAVQRRRAAAQLRRLSEPADRRLADEAAPRLILIIVISIIISVVDV